MRQRRPARLDLQDLPRSIAAALESALAGHEVVLAHGGVDIGTLTARPLVLDGQLLAPAARPAAQPAEAQDSPPGDVVVVATAMELSESARSRLAEEFGEGYAVLDLHAAPPTADVLLVPPISPQLLGALRRQFPAARILVTEIEDEELGVRCAGPVARMLEAGASAYLPPRPVGEVAGAVHAHLTREAPETIERSAGRHRRRLEG